MIKGIMDQKDIALINIYTLNQGALKRVKQLLIELKRETDKHTIVIRNLNIPLLNMDRSSKQKINKEITSLNNILEQLYIIDVYRAFHPKTVAYTFLSSAHGTFSRINHTLGHRNSLNKYKRAEIILTIFSDRNALKLKINCQKKSGKITNTWNNWAREEIKREFKRYIEIIDNDSTTYQNFWDTVKMVIRESSYHYRPISKYKNEPK
uniref:Uncharacterized protein n=1 Tax=Rousettus aegyptiacus TaxID=9407 RepID=A0A7J8C2E3_ROUAE|nr:hypothetical protein HJG63_009346 [Rousettus aegyptiacus]